MTAPQGSGKTAQSQTPLLDVPLTPLQIIEVASEAVLALKGHHVDVLTVKRPNDVQGAVELAKIVSKLSPIIGNLLEYAVVQYLNAAREWPPDCRWVRQDPEFPDVILSGPLAPDEGSGIVQRPGVEVKTWFPLATEMTARFRDSQSLLQSGTTKVAVLCWLPEWIIAGQPKIIDVWIGDALDVARARDSHYHNPPQYLVMEPEDTAARTRNLQQKNCNGFRFQGTPDQLEQARIEVEAWGEEGRTYSTSRECQALLRELTGRFPYRLDTNFAKIDRIVLAGLETWKAQVLTSTHRSRTVTQWAAAIARADAPILAELVDPDAPLPVEAE